MTKETDPKVKKINNNKAHIESKVKQDLSCSFPSDANIDFWGCKKIWYENLSQYS